MTQHSDATLLAWLATKPDKLERHLDKYPEDIDRLDRLTALEDDQVAAIEHTTSAPEEAIRESAKSTGSFLFVLHKGPLAFERAAQRRPDPDPAGA